MGRKSGLFDMQFITSSISTMLVLLLLGLVTFFVMTANHLSVYVRENIAFTILMDENAREADILAFQKRLNEKNYIRQTTYISKEQALKEQTLAMGTDPTEFLGYNPFAASIEVRLNAEYANNDSVRWIKEEILENKHVTDIDYPQELVDSVNRNIRKLSFLLLGLAGLLTLISFALINNTVRLTIYSQRFLLHTMQLVGASWSFIRRPFLARNLWVGVLAASLADACLMGMACLLIRYEPELLTVVTPQVMLTVMLTVFVTGILITTLCAYISINRFLRMRVTELYYK
ncbi:MAG: permease-like cell division protein FtsX [Phocaeicola plebeius]|nr:permease-like cell division protein FtsX [Phocaeicola plebeius]